MDKETNIKKLRNLVLLGLQKRVKHYTAEIKARLEYELEVIDISGLCEEFVVAQDAVNFAEQNCVFVCAGQGNICCSLVAYALGITKIEPISHKLYFERFLNSDVKHCVIPIVIVVSQGDEKRVVDNIKKKYGAEKIEQLKLSIVGSRDLEIIKRTQKYVYEKNNVKLDLQSLEYYEENGCQRHKHNVYAMISDGDIEDVYLSNDEMKAFMQSLQPREMRHLIAGLALVGRDIEEKTKAYIAAKNGQAKKQYDHELLAEILQDTYGIILYQEQVMEIMHKLGGFTFSEADIARRNFAKANVSEVENIRKKFITGCESNGIDNTTAGSIFDKTAVESKYAWSKAHAITNAYFMYLSAYLKCYHANEFERAAKLVL